ncbi:M48 family peptidase, partial [Candidatus Falkowbacteria bacterium]|nr:M48 family peptidase [Candidatus Falkowbacteria bacterium]
MARYVFITGGVVSSLGKGLASAALGASVSPAAGQLFNQAYGVGAQVGVILPHSRTQESEADEVGMILAAKAGYEPSGALSLWRKMDAYSKSKGQNVPAWMSTHPSSQQRIQAFPAYLESVIAAF